MKEGEKYVAWVNEMQVGHGSSAIVVQVAPSLWGFSSPSKAREFLDNLVANNPHIISLKG